MKFLRRRLVKRSDDAALFRRRHERKKRQGGRDRAVRVDDIGLDRIEQASKIRREVSADRHVDPRAVERDEHVPSDPLDAGHGGFDVPEVGGDDGDVVPQRPKFTGAVVHVLGDAAWSRVV